MTEKKLHCLLVCTVCVTYMYVLLIQYEIHVSTVYLCNRYSMYCTVLYINILTLPVQFLSGIQFLSGFAIKLGAANNSV